MTWNRNHYFLLGFFLVLLGGQLRMVDAFVLNEGSTRFLARQAAESESAPLQAASMNLAANSPLPIPRKTLRPPRWLGWSLLSLGAVLVLHAVALPKPEKKK